MAWVNNSEHSLEEKRRHCMSIFSVSVSRFLIDFTQLYLFCDFPKIIILHKLAS